jgi:hypothetical protein
MSAVSNLAPSALPPRLHHRSFHKSLSDAGWLLQSCSDRIALPAPLVLQGLDAGNAVVVAHIPIVFLLAQHPRPLSQTSD